MRQKKSMPIVLVTAFALMLSVLLTTPGRASATEATDDAETAPISDEDMQRINDALPPQTTTTRRMRSTGLGSSGKFVVALDAGHGGNDAGAVGNGLQEKALNLRIAMAAKAELESHGITVCMIRDSDTCVFSTNAALELQARVTKAYKAGASVYVSLHVNSGGSSGAEVWYPRTDISYFPECGTQGQGLASAILDALTNGEPYGIARRGIFQRKNVEDTYPDGSLSDYYAVIRHAREYGFTGIIVEHGFIDNASDAYNLNRHAEAMGRSSVTFTTGLMPQAPWRPAGVGWMAPGTTSMVPVPVSRAGSALAPRGTTSTPPRVPCIRAGYGRMAHGITSTILVPWPPVG